MKHLCLRFDIIIESWQGLPLAVIDEMLMELFHLPRAQLWNEFLYNIKSLKDFLHLGSDLGLVGDFVWHAKRADLTGFLSPLDTEAATWIQQLSSMQNLHPSGLLCGTTFDGLR